MENKYETVPFPEEEIIQVCLFRDDAVLGPLKSDSPDKPTLDKVARVYGDVYFPQAPDDRPYTFASIVVSVDGKIAFEDNPQGPLIAGKNKRDPKGGFSDFWVLNMLRSYADGVVVGARTMQTEPTMTAECFDEDLASKRVSHMGKRDRCPIHVVISFDGTDIPFGHRLFGVDAPILMATSPAGLDYVLKNSSMTVINLGNFDSKEQIMDSGAAQRFSKASNGELFVIGTGSGSTPDAEILLFFLRQSGLTRLLVEAPSYMTHLISIGAMDEMFMNYSTVFVGGTIGFGIYHHFESEDHPHSDFLQINRHCRNFIYTRQKLVYDA